MFQENVMHDRALQQVVLDPGGHTGGRILADNIGRLFKEGKAYGS